MNSPNPDSSRTTAAIASALIPLALLVGLVLATAAHGQSGGTVSPSDGSTTPAPAPSPGGPTQVFPIPTPHSYGDGFGAGRRHQGVDIFAPCGTDTIAVMNTKVVHNSFQKAAGHYVVLRNKKIKRDYVYMHLQSRSPLRKGQKVLKGQFVGPVGDTGRATGCHLHFEIWRGKWYRGGRALNPMRSLRSWDVYS